MSAAASPAGPAPMIATSSSSGSSGSTPASSRGDGPHRLPALAHRVADQGEARELAGHVDPRHVGLASIGHPRHVGPAAQVAEGDLDRLHRAGLGAGGDADAAIALHRDRQPADDPQDLLRTGRDAAAATDADGRVDIGEGAHRLHAARDPRGTGALAVAPVATAEGDQVAEHDRQHDGEGEAPDQRLGEQRGGGGHSGWTVDLWQSVQALPSGFRRMTSLPACALPEVAADAGHGAVGTLEAIGRVAIVVES